MGSLNRDVVESSEDLFSRDEIARMIIDAVARQKWVPRVMSRYSVHPKLLSMFNDGELMAEIHMGIMKVIEKYEHFHDPERVWSSKIRLSTCNEILGYFFRSLKNRIASIIRKNNAKKRIRHELYLSEAVPGVDQTVGDLALTDNSQGALRIERYIDVVEIVRHMRTLNEVRAFRSHYGFSLPRLFLYVARTHNSARMADLSEWFEVEREVIEKGIKHIGLILRRDFPENSELWRDIIDLKNIHADAMDRAVLAKMDVVKPKAKTREYEVLIKTKTGGGWIYKLLRKTEFYSEETFQWEEVESDAREFICGDRSKVNSSQAKSRLRGMFELKKDPSEKEKKVTKNPQQKRRKIAA